MEWTLDDVRSAAVGLYEFQAEYAARSAALAEHVAVPPAGADAVSAAQARLVASSVAEHYTAHKEANPKLGVAADALLSAAAKAFGTDAENAATLGGSAVEDFVSVPNTTVPALPDAPAVSNAAGQQPSGGEEAADLVRSGAGSSPLRGVGDALNGFAQFVEDGVDRVGSIRARVRSGMGGKTGDIVDAQLRGYQGWLGEQPASLRALAGTADSAADSHDRVVAGTHDPETLTDARDRVLRVAADYRSGKTPESDLVAAKGKYRELVDHNSDMYERYGDSTPTAPSGGPDPAPHIANPAIPGSDSTSGGDPWSPLDADLTDLDTDDPTGEDLDSEESVDDEGSKDEQQLVSSLVSALSQGLGALGQAVSGAVSQGVGVIGQAGQGAASAVQSLAAAPAAAKKAKDLGGLGDDLEENLDDLNGLGDLSAATSPMGAGGGSGGAGSIALGAARGDLFDGPGMQAGYSPGAAATLAASGGASSVVAPPMMGSPQKSDDKEHKRQKELVWKDAGMNLDDFLPAAGTSMIGSPAPAPADSGDGTAGTGTKEGSKGS